MSKNHALAAFTLLMAANLSAASFTKSPEVVTPQVPGSFAELSNMPGTAGHAEPVVQWWATLHDPELNAIIARAVQGNLDLKIAGARLLEARASRRVARADLLPSVETTTSFNRIRGGYESGNVHVGNIGSAAKGASGGANKTNLSGIFVAPFETNLFQLGFDASWEIDFFGGRRHELEAASADVRAAEESRRDALVSLLAECARNYVELRGTQRRIDIARGNIQRQTDSLHLTEVRAEAGLGTTFDVEREREQLATTEASVPLLETIVRQDIHLLSTLVGEPPTALAAELEQTKPLPLAPLEVPVGLPAELLTRRPDLRRAQAEVIAAAARVGQAKADLFPKIVLSGAAGRQSSEFSQFTLGAGNFFSLGPQLSLPIFNAGRIRGNIAASRRRFDQASTSYRNTMLTALRETEDSLAAYSREHQRRVNLLQAVESSKTATALATELYTRGLSDFLSVLDAQREQLNADDALAQSDTAALTDLVALYKALGGGWQ